MNGLNVLQNVKVWLLGIGGGLIALHLNLTWKSENTDLLSASLLFWLAVSILLWKKRDTISLDSDGLSSFLGIALIAVVLVKSTHIYGYDFFLRIFPLISLLGVGLLVSGFKGLKPYVTPLWLLVFLALYPGFIYIIDPSLLTAKFAAFVLWVLGFDVEIQGVLISLPTGSIEVYYGCSGILLICQLLGMALILMALVSMSWQQKIQLAVTAIGLGFAINGLRVALMAVLVALSDSEAFEYWHLGEGSLIFSAIAVCSFGLIYNAISNSKTQQVE